MKNIINTLFYSVIFIFLASCSSTKIKVDGKKVNPLFNHDLRKNIKLYEGTLSKSEYVALIEKLQIELQTEIPLRKSLLINYNQKSSHCHGLHFGKESFEESVDLLIKTTNQITSDNDALNFLVYAQETFYKDIYERKPEYQLDSGFFHNYVFTEHKLCQAFFIIKPNGKFYRGYQEYYDHPIKSLLEKDENL